MTSAGADRGRVAAPPVAMPGRRRLLAGFAAMGAGGWAMAAPAFTVVDPTGRTVSLPAAPRRIVSLVPSVTEILFALGAEERLVGVTDFCDFPAAARRKPRVGGMVAPSLEAIVALRPDLVALTSAGNRQETFEQLRRVRIPVYQVAPESIEDVLRAIAVWGS